jgi:hypothetical protein
MGHILHVNGSGGGGGQIYYSHFRGLNSYADDFIYSAKNISIALCH